MENVNVNFNFEGRDIIVQSSKKDQMKTVCQKFALKAETNLNSLIFLYGGNKVNLDLSLEAQASAIDKKNNEMKILVYIKENEDELTCPKCGEKLNLNSQKIDELILSNNNLMDSISGIQDQLENVIKISTVNKVNNQLKNIKTLINAINEDIQKNNAKLQNLSKEIIIVDNNYNNNNIQNIPTNFNKDVEGILNNPLTNEEKNQNDDENLKNLKKEIENKENIISELNSKNRELKNEIENYQRCEHIYFEFIDAKEREKKAMISNLPFIIKENYQLVCIIFAFLDKNIIKFPIICKSTQTFRSVEKLLYEEFPQYKKTENNFLYNGLYLDKSKTLKEIGINNLSFIQMIIPC